jgi:hypothetical protein
MPRRGDKPRELRPGVYWPGRRPVKTRRVFTGLINNLPYKKLIPVTRTSGLFSTKGIRATVFDVGIIELKPKHICKIWRIFSKESAYVRSGLR